MEHAQSEHAHLRYWAVNGLRLLPERNSAVVKQLVASLEDSCPEVRIAAAQALGALDVLEEAATHEEEWVRVFAVTALDQMDATAAPLIPTLQKALDDTNNKYVVRVSNQALNELLDTQNNVR